jgi:hypothetical protein
MAGTYVAQAEFTGDPNEATNGVAVLIEDNLGGTVTMENTDYRLYHGVETEDGPVGIRVPASSKTTTGFTVYPTDTFTGTVNFLVVAQ